MEPNRSDTSSDNSVTPMTPDFPMYHDDTVDHQRIRYPHCIVWTPIPCLTWFIPFIGHMGICTMQGVIRDFAGPFFVSEDNMGFGNPTKYWQLDVSKVPLPNSKEVWDRSVYEASEEYKGRMHNLCCDNCHSHVAYALNLMKYDGSTSWNMITLCFLMLFHSKYVSVGGFLKTWLPFLLMLTVVVIIVIFTRFI